MNKIIYLDAAASALKTDAVIAAEVDFLQYKYANAGRGVCARVSAVDDMVARTRADVAKFINAKCDENIVFTGGTTDAMNRIARLIDDAFSVDGDSIKNKTIMVSDLDHHSARLPFECIVGRRGCKIVLCPVNAENNLDYSNVARADVFVITAMSNVFGGRQDVARLVAAAREKNPDVITVVDAAQYVVHENIDVEKWDCDFMCFSAHKIGGDTGLGVMYVKNPDYWMSPDKFGGGMVARITGAAPDNQCRIQWEPAPARFEAGTLPLTQIAGLGAAIKEWTPRCGADVMRRIRQGLDSMPRVKIYTAPDAAILTFSVDGIHPLDFGAMCGARGLCMRVGNMCASWAMRMIDAPTGGVARLSAGPWNTIEDADRALEIIGEVIK